MSSPQQIRYLRPGQMPKASEWNSLVQKAKSGQPSKAGYDWLNGTAYRKTITPYRKPTYFYTSVAIPAYSVFAVKKYSSGDPVFEAKQFTEDDIEDYLEGYIGTNGQADIPANQNFYGYLLDEHHDDLVRIFSGAAVGHECGLSERAGFLADTDTLGMIITKSFQNNIYYVRKMNRMPDFFATLDEDFTVEDDSYTSVTLEDPETFAGESVIEEVYPAWNIPVDTEFEEDTRVIIRFDSKRNKWFFFKNSDGSNSIDVTVNGYQLTGFGMYRKHFIFDKDLTRNFHVNGDYTASPEKVVSSFGNTWNDIALQHPVLTSNWCVFNKDISTQAGNVYTTSQAEIGALTSTESSYSNTPAFTEIGSSTTFPEAMESVTISGTDLESGNYSKTFYKIQWNLNNNQVFMAQSGESGETYNAYHVFSGTSTTGLTVMNMMGVNACEDGILSNRTHSSIDTKIGTPFYTYNSKHYKLKSVIKKTLSGYGRYSFIEAKLNIGGITYKPDYVNRKIAAGNYQSYGEYRLKAQPTSCEDNLNFDFHFEARTGTSISFERWLKGSVDYKIYLDSDADKLYVDYNSCFRWEVPSGFGSKQISYSDPDGNSHTFVVSDFFGETPTATSAATGSNAPAFTKVNYDGKVWTYDESQGYSGSYALASSSYAPKVTRPDITFTFYGRRTSDLVIGEETVKIGKETVYLIDAGTFV